MFWFICYGFLRMTFKVLKAVHVNVTLLCRAVLYSYVQVPKHQI